MSHDDHSRETLGYLFGLVGVIVFGVTLPMTRLAVESFDPAFVTVGRAAAAGIAASGILLLTRQPLPRGRFVRLAVAGVGLIFGFPGFSALAMTTVPASHGGVVLGILPLATVFATVVVNGERPSPRFWVLAMVGAALVVGFALRDGAGTLARGDLWLAAAAVSAALGYALSGPLARTMPGWAVISWALVIALPVSVPLTIIVWHSGYAHAPATHWAALGYLSFFSMLIGFFAWNAGLALGGVARVSQVQLLQTFVTLAVAALLLGERIGLQTLTFAVAVSVVVMMGRRERVDTRTSSGGARQSNA